MSVRRRGSSRSVEPLRRAREGSYDVARVKATPSTPSFPVEWKKGLVAEVGSYTVATRMSSLVRSTSRLGVLPSPPFQSTRNRRVVGVLKGPKRSRGARTLSRGNRGVGRGRRRLYNPLGRSPYEATSTDKNFPLSEEDARGIVRWGVRLLVASLIAVRRVERRRRDEALVEGAGM